MLIAAGAPEQASDLIQVVCDTCPACRAWHRPGKRPIATSRVVTDFNQDVQVDLLFCKSHVVMHMHCTLVRLLLRCSWLTGLRVKFLVLLLTIGFVSLGRRRH